VAVTGDDHEGQRPPRPPRRGLTAEGFEALLAWLDPDPKKAGELYVAIRYKLARFIEWRGCYEAEELADETLNRVARWLLAQGPPGVDDRYNFCHGFARKVLQEYWRRVHRPPKPQPPAVEPEPEEEDQLLDALRRCLDRLPGDDRRLILRYYDGEDRIRHRRQLAQERGLTLNALRIQAHRVRLKVLACMQRTGRAVETFSLLRTSRFDRGRKAE
jgi:DNA-directed RNA polymerase specialized sigma24 family protein